jgi:hypothetical protein
MKALHIAKYVLPVALGVAILPLVRAQHKPQPSSAVQATVPSPPSAPAESATVTINGEVVEVPAGSSVHKQSANGASQVHITNEPAGTPANHASDNLSVTVTTNNSSGGNSQVWHHSTTTTQTSNNSRVQVTQTGEGNVNVSY